MRHETILQRDNAVLVVIDIQEKLFPVIDNHAEIAINAGRLITGVQTFAIPVIISQQYTKGLGATIPSLRELANNPKIIEKTTFSCNGEKDFIHALEDLGREQIILCGIETHICVMQTALDLLAKGKQVHVVKDAVGSRSPDNREIALSRIQQEGAIVTCTESVLFELLGEAGTKEFSTIAKLIR